MITEPQKLIIESIEGNFLVVAGPGSGKTRTLIERYKNLILNGVKEENILVTTFTNEAVFEIIERLEQMKDIHLTNPNIFTIDKFFYDIVHSINPNLKVTEEELNEDSLDKIYDKFFSYIKVDKVTASKLSHKYKYIMIDEFQDTSEKQWLAITKLFPKHKNIVAIGDSNQSIYSWRNAVQSIFEEFKFYYNAYELFLYENFRCSQNIIEFANHYIKLNYENLVTDVKYKYGPPVKLIDQNSVNIGKYIANKIKFHILEHKLELSDIAIISRYTGKSDYGTFKESDIIHTLLQEGIYTTRDPTLVNKKLYDEIYNEMVKNINKVGRIITTSLEHKYHKYISKKFKKLARYLNKDSIKDILEINKIYDCLSEIDKINFISIHNSKGKEYKVVFLLIPHMFPYLNYDLSLPSPYNSEGQELVRLNYVGFTRAKKYLYIFHDQYLSEDKFDKFGDSFHEYVDL